MADTTLYRAFDEYDELLYVGISLDAGRRFKEHSGAKDWWHEVAYVRLWHFRNRRDALEAETAAIRSESPLYNVKGVPAEIVDAEPRDDRDEASLYLERYWVIDPVELADSRVPGSTLLAGYIDWCQTRGAHAGDRLTRRQLFRFVEFLGAVKTRNAAGVAFAGIAPREPWGQQ